jgi:signal transduction histidine kinase
LLYIAHITSVYLIVGSGAFRNLVAIGAGAVVAFLAIAIGMAIVRRGFASFDTLRARLADVRHGRQRRVIGAFPTEVQPLVDDLNALLEHREQRVQQAVSKAGDLAHGLKTPLAVVNHEADRLERVGEHDSAATLRQQTERMQRHVDYHLAHARAAASGATPGTRCAVHVSADALARTLQRLHTDRGLTFEVRVPEHHVVRCEREDLDEILGNLLDNACKWARTRIVVTSELESDAIGIAVDDDGPGIGAEIRQAVLERGVRFDQISAGSGFGLAIVNELVSVYGGALALDTSPFGGLRARVLLPKAER